MGFGLDRRARSRKAKGGLRALLGKAPEAAEVGDRLVRLARRMLQDAVIDASPRRVTLRLHPAAAPVRVVVLPDGDLEITGETATVGPGYHRHVEAVLAPLLEELEYVWADDAPDVRAAITAWVAAELRAGATRLALPEARAFVLDAAVLTPLGPRDRAWCDAVLADPERAADMFAWWDDGPGQAARARALLALWHDVPWREPLDADERALMERVDADLTAARTAEPALALPWTAWAELRGHLGDDEAALAELRAHADADPAPPIGYRRYPLEIELTATWSIELPGAFVGRWEDDGDRYWATDGERMIELVSFTADDSLDAAALLAIAPEKHLVIARIDEPERQGRAEAYTEGTVHIVIGLVAVAPEVAILTCKGPPGSEASALATWRSLRARRHA